MNKLLMFVILSTVFVLTGCGLTPKQTEGVTTFSKASKGIGDFTATTLSEMRISTIEMNEKSIAIRKNSFDHERKALLGNVCNAHKECKATLQQQYDACKKNEECNVKLTQTCQKNTDCKISSNEKKVKFEKSIISGMNLGKNAMALISEICKKDKNRDQKCEDEFDDRIFFGAFSTQNITARIGAAKALSSYGQLLKALVDDTQEAEIKQASEELAGSIKDVKSNNSDKALNDDQLESLGKAVEFIGETIVEYKKAQAVKKIVLKPVTKKAVDTLCDLLIADFDSGSDGKLAAEYSNTIETLERSVSKGLRNETNLQNREILLEAYNLAYDNDAKLNTVVKQAKNTLEKLKAANSQLVDVLKDDDAQDISSIKKLVGQFQQLRNAVTLIGNNQ